MFDGSEEQGTGLFFKDRVKSPSCPRTSSVEHPGLDLTEFACFCPPPRLGLKVCDTTAQFRSSFDSSKKLSFELH